MRHIASGAALAALLAAAQPAAAATYEVGMLLPYSGVYAALGQEIDDGMSLALEEFGGDTTFDIVREDTEVKPPVGLAKARKLVLQDEVDVIAGIVSSGVLGAVRDFIDGAKVPLVVANAGNDDMTGAACSPYIIRVSFSNSQVNRPMGQWLYDRGIRKVYTLAPDYAAGHQQIDAFAGAFEAAGGEIVGSEFTPFQKTKDFGPYITKAQASGADAVYVFYAGSEAIAFVKQYDAFGLKDEMPLFGSGFLTSPLYVNAEGAAAEGVVTSLHYVPTIDTEVNREFVERFKAKFGRPPSEYAVQGYDAGRLIAEAAKAAGEDKSKFAEALRQVKFTGPRGPLEIDPKTNNIVQNVYIYETVAGGEWLTQKILDVVEGVRDAPNGCAL